MRSLEQDGSDFATLVCCRCGHVMTYFPGAAAIREEATSTSVVIDAAVVS
jgi:hypothetical protein